MLEMENLDLKDSEVCPLSLIRDIAPRSMKVAVKTLKKWKHKLIAVSAEGSGPRRAASVCVSPAGRRQTHRGDPQGQEPPQDGYHRHVRWGEEHNKVFRSNEMNSIHVKFIRDLFNFLSCRSICQDLSPSQRPENIEKENSRKEEDTKSCLQRVLCVRSSENR